MRLYNCDYYREKRDDPFAPGDAECPGCYRYDICLAGFIKENGHDPSTHTQPLTLEELKDRIGKKVWVQSPDVTEYGRLAIVEDVDIKQRILYLVDDFTCHDYGRVWEAYDHT